ncbi:MAG TPA: ABC transporter substrate-binding protein [Methylomirabilota bacterium]|jgi:putative ABC transport system substrate-binding protein|nr:ABC transporter substrate-binding protein [Methylomirabilota bacterium]
MGELPNAYRPRRRQGLINERRLADDWAPQEMADDLARGKVDVIVAYTTHGIKAAKRATATIPIVFVAGNPLEFGVISSLGRPGGNATGVALPVIGSGKAAQLLKEAVPTISRLVVVSDPRSTVIEVEKVREATAAALKPLGVAVQWIPISGAADAGRMFGQFSPGIDGLILQNAPAVAGAAKRICGIARERRLPTLGTGTLFADAGCLMAYGNDSHESSPSRRMMLSTPSATISAQSWTTKPVNFPSWTRESSDGGRGAVGSTW